MYHAHVPCWLTSKRSAVLVSALRDGTFFFLLNRHCHLYRFLHHWNTCNAWSLRLLFFAPCSSPPAVNFAAGRHCPTDLVSISPPHCIRICVCAGITVLSQVSFTACVIDEINTSLLCLLLSTFVVCSYIQETMRSKCVSVSVVSQEAFLKFFL